MTTRRPPALANWLLNRFGVARQNPPLAGDLLEEFRSGRSSAWFWRQTLVVILTGLARSARNSRRLLTGAVIGRTAQVGVAFLLWLLHFPPKLPHDWRFAGFLLIPLGGILLKKRYRKWPVGGPFFQVLTVYCFQTLMMGQSS